MASQTPVFSIQSKILRRINNRLMATYRPECLGTILQQDLNMCKDILSATEEQLKASQTDAIISVHKFRTILSTRLQDKQGQQNLVTTIGLVKLTISLGGYETLSKSAHWTRSLLSLLTAPLHAKLQELAIMTLTSIYVATKSLPTLAREITTPTLPAFITACLQFLVQKDPTKIVVRAQGQYDLSITALQALATLLPSHPATFRPFVSQLRKVLGPMLAPTDSSHIGAPQKARGLAQSIHALLPRCAAKNGAAEDWVRYVRLLKQQLDVTADQVFRSVIEDTLSTQGYFTSALHISKPDEPPGGDATEELHLPAWKGLDHGVSRLIGLLQTLQAYISTTAPTGVTYTLPVNVIEHTSQRIATVFPGQRLIGLNTFRGNPDISRDEREQLFLHIANLHKASFDLLSVLLYRLGDNMSSFQGALDFAVWYWDSHVESAVLREAIYGIVGMSIRTIGPALTKESVSSLKFIVKAACKDVLSRNIYEQAFGQDPKDQQQQRKDADAYLQTAKAVSPPRHDDAARQAALYLMDTIKWVAADAMPGDMRIWIDKTILLSSNHDAMVASILNQPTQKTGAATHASIMPFVAREHPASTAVEALIRPRMPMMPPKQTRADLEESDDEDLNAGHSEFTGAIRSSLHSVGIHEDRPKTSDKVDLGISEPIAPAEDPIEPSSQLYYPAQSSQPELIPQTPQVPASRTTASSVRDKDERHNPASDAPILSTAHDLGSALDFQASKRSRENEPASEERDVQAKRARVEVDRAVNEWAPAEAITGTVGPPVATTAEDDIGDDSSSEGPEIPPIYLESDDEEDEEDEGNERQEDDN